MLESAADPSGPGRLATVHSPAPRPPRAEIVVVSADDVLLEQVGQSLDGTSTVRQADTPADARALVRPSMPCVLVLDARGHDTDLAQVVEGLQSGEGTRVVVVLAPADGTAEIARAVRGSAAFAVLPIPLEPTQTSAVIEGAAEEALARHALLTAAPPEAPRDAATPPASEALQAPTPAPRKRATAAVGRGRRAGAVPARAVAVLAIAVLCGAVAWLGLRDPAPQVAPSVPASGAVVPEAAPAPGAVAPTPLPATSVDDLLDAARAAMRERRYTDPADDNAFDRYRAVLQLDPANGEAREGLQRIAAVLQARLESALQERRIDEATHTLGLLHSIRPDAPELDPLEARLVDLQLRQALAGGDLDRARALLARAAGQPSIPRAEVARWQAELDRQHGAAEARRLADLVALRIRQGRLVAPAGDSAKHHLAQLRRVPGDSGETVALATTALQQAYLDRLRDALARSQRGEVDRWRAEARALGVGAAEIAAVQREVTARAGLAESRQQAARTAERVRERIGDGRLLEPAGDSALFHLDALRALEPAGSVVRASERELSTKLIERARAALAADQLDVARTHASAARQLGVDPATVAALERQIATSAAVDAPAQSAPPPRLTRTRHVAPDYPKDALKRRLGGQVRLRLTVDAGGKVIDALVVRAEPAGVFDAAATNAARKWRYKPIGPKDSDVTATATVDVAFRPEEASQ